MIKRLFPVALAATVAAAAHAETRTVDVGHFTAIDAANGVAVEVALGGEPSVVIDGPEDMISRIDVSVRGDTLRVRPNQRRLRDVVVRVSAPSLERVEAANGAVVSLESVPDGAELALSASNGGVVDATGVCRSVEADASRGGVIAAGDLACASAVGSASMGGVTTVRADESLTVRASMGGVVEALGDAKTFDSSASMGGVVSRKQEGG